MRTIHKFELPILGMAAIYLPKEARVLSVANQNETTVAMWVELDPDAPKVVERRFVCAGTGHTLPSEIGAFIGTVLFDHGRLVSHVFEHTS